MVDLHKKQKALGWGDFTLLPTGSKAVIAYLRRSHESQLLILNNLSDVQQAVSLNLPEGRFSFLVDLFSTEKFQVKAGNQLALTLHPYQYLWLNFGT
jgi:maltose alpha-D-glucosyltransferase / alpha-amylase